ncbi:MAG: hypothetical protein KJ893_09880 [Candidatus Omnitrophica bacterium]|nr:hypothetical protein [Candidatus Omnitrophota bacterium]MCG2703272.1 hypothetical protein [Candidatus Omnitrophota bacterium]
MKHSMIRVWNELDIETVKRHLLIAGELTANCENCRHLGIDFAKERACPQCRTEFRYICFRTKSNKGEEFSAIRRLKEKRPDMIIVDYEDIKHASGKSKVHGLFDK